MKALFCHDHHYYKQGNVTLSKGQYHNSVWQRYLDHFESLTVVGREGGTFYGDIKALNTASRDNVSFDLMPDTNSLSGIVLKRKKVKESIRLLVADHDIIILRGISEIGSLAYKEAKRQGKFIAMEMVACAWDELWYHGSIKAKLYAPYRFLKGRMMAKNADAIIYVSQKFLQNRYPSNASIQAAASNVQIDANSMENYTNTNNKLFKIGLIGTLKNKLKGVHVVIQAAAILRQRGIKDFAFHILGPGDPNAAPCHFAAQAEKSNVSDLIHFDGLRPSGSPVIQWIRQMDLYIQPSFQEGVPRATIESMAQGRPVIGSTAGGIAELLDETCIVPRGNATALADKIEWMMENSDIRSHHSERNFNYAKNFTMDCLVPIRLEFWGATKNQFKNKDK
jgi:glycosyltransferase involved in cell wall biosynthesis